jgi:hypothetical protein
MAGFVDIALPAKALAAAETLGLKVSRSVLTGLRARQVPREDAEIAIVYLREWGFLARIIECTPDGETPAPPLGRAA